MTTMNLSELGGFQVITVGTPEGVKYWGGGEDWHLDPKDTNIKQFGVGAAAHWRAFFQDRGMNIVAVNSPGQYVFMLWPDLGWVVLNHRERLPTVHRVRMINQGADWFFSHKREGSFTISREEQDTSITVSLKDNELDVVTVFGKDGEPFHMNSFSIDDSSNLKYLFELDIQPAI